MNTESFKDIIINLILDLRVSRVIRSLLPTKGRADHLFYLDFYPLILYLVICVHLWFK